MNAAESRGRGLATFGAVMMVIAGAFNALDGIVALVNPDYLHDVLVGNLTVWGWVLLLFGVAQVGVGVLVLRGSEVALWPGIVLAGVNCFTQFANIEQFPLWAIATMILDVFVIYAFTLRGMALGVVEVDSEPVAQAPVDDRPVVR